MKINVKEINQIEIFQLEGKLVYEELEALKTVREKIATSSAKSFLLDLERVTVIDSSGIGAIVGLFRETLLKDARFALLKPTKNVLESIEVIGVEKLFKIYQSEKEAIEGVSN